ncbi:cell surface protein [Diaporthe eres]|uniref:Cell surface protein n=1 Tax=Diaporthe vaccinii TaxID=105482 RepID=A0ABR4F1A0_9PEZI|nr:cell surface protein [Diaporthe eres]
MRSSTSVAVACLAASVSAHGVVTKVTGANGVEMPGLTVADGTPRDCSSNGCGSQADTAIIRDREVNSGAVGPLGKTQGNGPVDPAMMIKVFMGDMDVAQAPTNGASSGVGQEDDLSGAPAAAKGNNRVRQLLAGLLGGGGGGANAQGAKSTGPPESMVKAMAGAGSSSGMPTANEDGTVDVTFRQINQDGAGPLEAMVDGTSGGTDMAAFQEAQVTQDVPGLVAGISATTTTDFPVKVQMPAGTTCDATVGSATNVCVMRLRNNTPAGPFGGAVAFTQTPAARKRALEYRKKMKKARAFQA